MERAIQLARKARFQTDPNPMVGAILTTPDLTILSEGYHKKAGMPHAEVIALNPFDQVPEDSILFVTLEPCIHYGRTPPCADLILQKKVGMVIVGSLDPHPKVTGKGVKKLKEAGVKVITGICEKKCTQLNRVFNKHIVDRIPYLSLKVASTLDGRIAMPSGKSQWITGTEARAFGHRLRSQHQAIAVGRKTLDLDNPKLNDRISEHPRNPIRVVFSNSGNISLDSAFVLDQQTKSIVITGNRISRQKLSALKSKGVTCLVSDSEQTSLHWALKRLYHLGICSLLVEGGAGLASGFIRENLVDEIYLFLSGKIIGSQLAPGWSGELQIDKLTDAPRVSFQSFRPLGEDLLIIGNFTR